MPEPIDSAIRLDRMIRSTCFSGRLMEKFCLSVLLFVTTLMTPAIYTQLVHTLTKGEKTMGKLMQINPQRVRQRLIRSVLGAMVLTAIATPALAQTRDNMQEFERANRVAEALRRVTLQGNTRNPGYYSDWQVKGDRIPLWSQQCLGRGLTPEQFEADQAAATAIVTCIVQDMMRMEIRSAGNDEALAIRRLAAWWVTGDPEQYDTNVVSDYTKRVLSVYQPNGRITAARPTPPKPISIDTTALNATTATLPAPVRATPTAQPRPTAAATPKPAATAATPTSGYSRNTG